MKTFNLIDDLRVIQFDGTFECKEKLNEVFYEYAPIDWEYHGRSDKIKLIDFPRLFEEVVEGDYIIRDRYECPLLIEQNDFERLFEVEDEVEKV